MRDCIVDLDRSYSPLSRTCPSDGQGSVIPRSVYLLNMCRYGTMGRMRWVRWVVLAAFVPVAVSLGLVVVCVWLAIWTTANLTWAVREQSAPALTRAVDGASLTAEVASWIAAGWGALGPPFRVSRKRMTWPTTGLVSEAGRDLAPALPSLLGLDEPRTIFSAG